MRGKLVSRGKTQRADYILLASGGTECCRTGIDYLLLPPILPWERVGKPRLPISTSSRSAALPILDPAGRNPELTGSEPTEASSAEQSQASPLEKGIAFERQTTRKIRNQAEAGGSQKPFHLPGREQVNLPVGRILLQEVRVAPPDVAVGERDRESVRAVETGVRLKGMEPVRGGEEQNPVGPEHAADFLQECLLPGLAADQVLDHVEGSHDIHRFVH